MSNAGVFLVGLLITLVVFVALGILAYGIKLEDADLKARELDQETDDGPVHLVGPLSPASSPGPIGQTGRGESVKPVPVGHGAVSPPSTAA
ncbi:MAG: hypothetical protein M3Z95_03740 [Actinomycetota bacterium]|nr:hypothetical protein [Actinomycetota bacterium]